ncbi:hypothetical protein HJG60_008801 [Phyllostomus discolor]|uniref:Uncharacterized protein n=1 Tax=Phyllostomus discolor TaxID=89673 RepID=A0A833YWG9_9CHIR|nr:hypothetical protein HJG60_008801 [Phyllostomus discolor]
MYILTSGRKGKRPERVSGCCRAADYGNCSSLRPELSAQELGRPGFSPPRPSRSPASLCIPARSSGTASSTPEFRNWSPPFSLGPSSYRFVNFVDPFEQPTLGFLDFFPMIFLFSVVCISHIIFITSFLLLGLDLVCFSLSDSLRWDVRFFI